MARVSIQNLHKFFKGLKGEPVVAVRDVSLIVEDKELVVLVGPSGCGKTTTLRMIAGLEDIDRGTIAIDGRVVNEVPPKDRDIAMVFQNYALYPHMTVYENLAFGLKLRKFPRPEIGRRVNEAAETLGLTHLLDRLPKALSGGQRQRVAVGRAIVRKPKVFLFDEPLSNLDAPMRAQMRVEITKLHRRLAVTMVYVTHDQVEAMTMGDRVVVMKEGMIQQVAGPMTLYREPSNLFVAGFIGSPPMNFFGGTIRRSGDGLGFEERRPPPAIQTGPFTLRLDETEATKLTGYVDREIVFGLRPEDVQDAAEAASSPTGRRVSALVEAVEPLGAQTHLHLTTSTHAFVARVAAGASHEPGSRVSLVFAPGKGHFFDPTSEGRIK
jgi:multiple sugar transport system ATP-binding protein